MTHSKIQLSFVAVHGLLALGCLYGVGQLLYLGWLEKPGENEGLYIGAAGAAFCTLLFALAAIGLWKGRSWGYWSGLAIVTLATAALGYGFYDDGDMDVLPVLLPFALLFIAHVAAPVYRRLKPGAEAA